MPDPELLVRKVCGFLEESPGVRSSTRLLAFLCFACAALLTLGMLGYIFYCVTHKMQPDANVISSIVLGLTAFVSQGAVAIFKRGSGE